MGHTDPELTEQEEETDVEAHNVLTPEGHPLEEITHAELQQGVDFDRESIEDSHRADHPTPDRPSGRLIP